ncbi:integral membrane sensor signal transduction histidine kinase [[Bacillus] selenitireducens MLS10]|uniref:histidine kinase n=2 Tax=Salisediminibacterium selenitireducens TaxID=85683 RepID=D6XUQ3_BACIE|nr:integral membrane sensor signal transduction histidine kinase [[Bacillus] selenitireducens MLS10]
MTDMISGMINNAFFVFFPIFLYYLFYHQGKERFFNDDRLALSILFSISITFSMLFPYQFLPGEDYLFDLRQVPLIIGTLYGGYIVGIVLFTVSAVVRVLIGGEGVSIALINQFAIFALVPLLRPYYFKLKHHLRIFTVATISVISIIFNSIFGYILFNDPLFEILDVIGILIINQAVFIVLTTIVIERIIKNNYIEKNMQKHGKLEAVSHLSASISHEIRNPLQVIKGFIQLLDAKEYPREKQKEFYQHINDEIESAEKIINDYLMFAKPTFDYQVTISVEKEIKKAVSIIQPYAHFHSVTVKEPILVGDHIIRCDEHRFKQVIINIARNCIEAMGPGGELVIDVFGGKDSVQIEIKDNGKGMTTEQIARLGEPYFSNKTSGTGLGMMVVYSILKNIGGAIDVQSVPGEGSIFTLSFPLNDQQND